VTRIATEIPWSLKMGGGIVYAPFRGSGMI